jgi:hypothetical protein
VGGWLLAADGGPRGRKPGIGNAWHGASAPYSLLVVLHDEAAAKATWLQPSPSIEGSGLAMTAKTIKWLMDDPFPFRPPFPSRPPAGPIIFVVLTPQESVL